jgi:uncharacterized protein
MLLGNSLVVDESTLFRSLRKENLTFEEVFQNVVEFIRSDTNSSYKISIGTDSQVGSKTVFVTCIHIHRIGRGAIGFLHKCDLPRQVKNLREKIYLETCVSLQLAYLFDESRIRRIRSLLGDKVSFEFHIDVGTKGETKMLITEMVGMVKGLDFIPKIKPDSYCASCFADRYTRAM